MDASRRDTTSFFAHMQSFTEFTDLLREENYISVPSDWWVIITDVRGSTKAIEEGRYKEVNTVGAATLAALQNAMGSLAFPFVFGGEALCQELRESYAICYGLHISQEVLMICYVPGFADGQHIHFIDGGDGGYAKQLKAQLKE